MNLPKLTHLQYFVLSKIGTGTRSSKQLMAALSECDEARDPSAFYQLMSRVENARLVKGRYRSTTFQSKHYRERFYTVTPKGLKLLDEMLQFYGSACRWNWMKNIPVNVTKLATPADPKLVTPTDPRLATPADPPSFNEILVKLKKFGDDLHEQEKR